MVLDTAGAGQSGGSGVQSSVAMSALRHRTACLFRKVASLRGVEQRQFAKEALETCILHDCVQISFTGAAKAVFVHDDIPRLRIGASGEPMSDRSGRYRHLEKDDLNTSVPRGCENRCNRGNGLLNTGYVTSRPAEHPALRAKSFCLSTTIAAVFVGSIEIGPGFASSVTTFAMAFLE